MRSRFINSPDGPIPVGGYAQAVEVQQASRLLFISGQIPEDNQGYLAKDFEGQCRQVWDNVIAQLRAADMTLDNLVRVTTYLSDRSHAVQNRAIRHSILGERTPAMTVIIADIFDPAWLLEIEAIAAA